MFARLCLLVLLASAWLAAPATAAFERKRGTNLDDCVEKLKGQGGGWCEIRVSDAHPSISSVWPANLDDRTRMRTGPRSVLIAWNSAAFDRENLLLYFTGGGHTDYGGNEVYEFDLRAGKWSRLTDPSPLDHLYVLGSPQDAPGKIRYCWSPDQGREPASGHSYDGMEFSRVTKTILLITSGPANGSCFNDEPDAFEGDPKLIQFRRSVYEFNPSRDETRGGLAPLTWRVLTSTVPFLGYPRMVELADGSMLIGSKSTMHKLDPRTGEIGDLLWNEADGGDGVAAYHPRGLVMLLKRPLFLARDPVTGGGWEMAAPRNNGKSLAVRRDGMVFTWDGHASLWTLDLSGPNAKWHWIDWTEGGPPEGDRGRVYGKWQYVESHDAFVGISDISTGVWIYVHPDGLTGVPQQ